MPSRKWLNSQDANGNKLTGLAAASASSDAMRKAEHDSDVAAAKDRANHTGSQASSTISDFDTRVRSSRLDQMAAATAPITIVDAVSASQAVTKSQLDAAIAGLQSGTPFKGSVEVVHASGNVNVANPGTATFDGQTIATGEVVFLAANTTPSQNGPWTFNGSGAAMTRPANWDTSAEALPGSTWVVKRGTSGDAFVLVTNDAAITLGTTAITSVVRGLASATVDRYTETCPAVSAGGTWTINHGLGITQGAAIASVVRTANPADVVDAVINLPAGNSATVTPDSALALGEYRFNIVKVA